MASFKAKFTVLQELFAKKTTGGGAFAPPPPTGARVMNNLNLDYLPAASPKSPNDITNPLNSRTEECQAHADWLAGRA